MANGQWENNHYRTERLDFVTIFKIVIMDFNEILDSMLTDYEQGKHQDIDALLKEKGQELGLSPEGTAKVERATETIDRMAKNMESLQDAKSKGQSLKRWMTDSLEDALEPIEDVEAKEKLIDSLAEEANKVLEKQIQTIG